MQEVIIISINSLYKLKAPVQIDSFALNGRTVDSDPHRLSFEICTVIYTVHMSLLIFNTEFTYCRKYVIYNNELWIIREMRAILKKA